MPVFNEESTIMEILEKIYTAELPQGFEKEVVIVDDGSEDKTSELIDTFFEKHPELHMESKVRRLSTNRGKGAALRQGFGLVKGDIILIQDGDLEYEPKDYFNIFSMFKDSKIDIVYGSRFLNGIPKSMKLRHLLANKILTGTANLIYGQSITDEATGYKAFRRTVLEKINLKSNRFDFCSEFLAKVSLENYRIHEVPISYRARSIREGKKIRSKDGFTAFWTLIKHKL